LPVVPAVDRLAGQLAHDLRVPGNAHAVERRLHEAPVPQMRFAPRRGDQAVAEDRAQLVELDALAELLRLDDEHPTDEFGAVQDVCARWAEPDRHHVAERAGRLEEAPRVAQEVECGAEQRQRSREHVPSLQ
jgi:hypothetical protein